MKHSHRFFISSKLGSGDTAFLDHEDSFHVSRVLRLDQGDRIELADSRGKVYTATIVRTGSKVQALAEAEVKAGHTPVSLTVAQAVTGGRKMDFMVEKLCELGVGRLAPVFTDKAVVRKLKSPGDKVERWRRLARAAASQSKRRQIMAVAEPVGLKAWVQGHEGEFLVLATETQGEPLGKILEREKMPSAVVIGPEGGFTEDELGYLKAAGAGFTSLGQQVLRTETAAVVTVALIMHYLGALG